MFTASVTRVRVRAAQAIVLSACLTGLAHAQPQAPVGRGGRGGGGATDQIPSIDERVSAFKKIDGFFPLYWDEAAGRLWMEVPKINTEVLYSTGVAAGLGSN